MPPPAAERGSATVTVSAVAAVLLLLLAVIAGAVGGITGQEASACTAQPAASSNAASIPANYLADFKAAGTRYNVPWTVLAAIGDIESGFGANDGPSTAGALGPMQFKPSTWAIYGNGGNIMNPADAIPAAARLLVANGAPGNLRQALLAYNDASWYVTEVLDQAARYAAGGTQATSAAGSAVCQQAALGPLPADTAGKILAYAEAQLGKPYIFSGGPGGQVTLNPRVCPAQKADTGNSSGATGVVQATLDPEQRCVAGAAILYAAAQLGKPYLWGGTGPDAFDCSGLVMMAYRAAGVVIPRTSQEQWTAGPWVPSGHEQPGDLVFFAGSDGTPQSPGHVGLVIGDGEMIEAYAAGYPIRISTYGLSSSPAGDQAMTGFTRPSSGLLVRAADSQRCGAWLAHVPSC
jgi:cell wall-associated NlpC family hydrolase